MPRRNVALIDYALQYGNKSSHVDVREEHRHKAIATHRTSPETLGLADFRSLSGSDCSNFALLRNVRQNDTVVYVRNPKAVALGPIFIPEGHVECRRQLSDGNS